MGGCKEVLTNRTRRCWFGWFGCWWWAHVESFDDWCCGVDVGLEPVWGDDVDFIKTSLVGVMFPSMLLFDPKLVQTILKALG